MKTGEDAVAELLDTLNQLSIDYMVVGSFSSNRYGVPRATKDADLVLKIETAERETLFSKLPESFEIDPQVTFEMVTGTWRQIIEIPTIPFTIELFELSKDLHDQERFSRRKLMTLLARQAGCPQRKTSLFRSCAGTKEEGAQRILTTRSRSWQSRETPSTGPTSRNGAPSTGHWMC